MLMVPSAQGWRTDAARRCVACSSRRELPLCSPCAWRLSPIGGAIPWLYIRLIAICEVCVMLGPPSPVWSESLQQCQHGRSLKSA